MPDTGSWSAPDFPFAIDYSPLALEEIRTAVSDAFYSLPRGGVEVGGILLGKWDGGRLSISRYKNLDCEHALGPSFTLSPRDRIELAKMIATAQASGTQVVGWYHSHTRSEIALSPADLEIYRHFFPEPWQVALVLRPHSLLPMRAGIFFRDAKGSVRSEAPYKEVALEPLDAKTEATAVSEPPEATAVSEPPEPVETAPVLATPPVSSPPEPPAAPAVEPPAPPPAEKARVDAPIPSFLESKPPARRVWPKIAIPLLIGAAIGAPAYWKRDLWIPVATSFFNPARAATRPAPALGLNVIAIDGQLEIRWDRNSAAVTGSAGGVLRVTGADPSMAEIWLDHQHLLSGAFTVSSPSERVDVSLALNQPSGPPVIEATAFAGKLPEPNQANGGGADEITRLRTDLDNEIQRNRKLQKDVDFLAKQWRDMRSKQ